MEAVWQQRVQPLSVACRGEGKMYSRTLWSVYNEAPEMSLLSRHTSRAWASTCSWNLVTPGMKCCLDWVNVLSQSSLWKDMPQGYPSPDRQIITSQGNIPRRHLVPKQNNGWKLGSSLVDERIQRLLLVIQGAKFILTSLSQMTD
jgi:hypothetical protein